MVEKLDDLLFGIQSKYGRDNKKVDTELEKIANEENLSLKSIKERYASLTKVIEKYVDAVADSFKKE